MRNNSLLAGCISLLIFPAPVFANGGDFVGGLIAGVLGSAIVNDANRRSRATHYAPAISSAQRAANREVQTSLNYFGYPVGTPDGVFGGRTREGISAYQAFMGGPVTGQLTDYEQKILVTAYYRGMAGGPAVSQLVNGDPMGTRALLLQQRDEMAGIADGQAAVSPVIAPAAKTATTTASATVLPSFLGTSQEQVSLASHCNKVSLQTNTNGGFQTVATMKEPEFALSEQFCLARTYVMSAAEDMEAKITGFTPQQVQDQCMALGPVLKDYVSSLSLKPEPEVLTAVEGFVVDSGMAPAQLAATAKICLGVGYTTDNMEVAVGSALILTALGQKSYAELLGHHLALGFGTSQRRDLAVAWYDTSIAAMNTGDMAVAPGMPDRAAVLKMVAYSVTGQTTVKPAAPVIAAGATTAALPTFSAAP